MRRENSTLNSGRILHYFHCYEGLRFLVDNTAFGTPVVLSLLQGIPRQLSPDRSLCRPRCRGPSSGGRLSVQTARLPENRRFWASRGRSVGANGRCVLCLGLKLPEPSQRTEARQKAIFASPRDNKLRQSREAPGKRTPRKTVGVCNAVRSRDGIFRGAPSEEAAIVHPLRLDELELPPEIGSNKSED
jgi:hypothetical protein